MAVFEFTSAVVYKSIFTAFVGVTLKWLYDAFRQRQVSEFLVSIMAYIDDAQEEAEFSRLHGCQPPLDEYKHRWPWALDLIKRHVDVVSGIHGEHGYHLGGTHV